MTETTEVRPIDKALEILELTNDGDALSGGDLKVVEMACNDALNEDGLVYLDQLLDKCRKGYTLPWLFDIPNLTRDQEGYVYWKGREVEHYSSPHSDEERTRLMAYARRLAEQCDLMDRKGIPVNGRTAMDWHRWFAEAPGYNDWVKALMKFYTVMANDERAVVIIARGDGSAACHELTFITREIVKNVMDTEEGLFDSYHHYQRQGMTSVTDDIGPGYARMVNTLEASGYKASMLLE